MRTGGDHAPDAACLAALASFLFPTIGRFLLPLAVLLVTGEVNAAERATELRLHALAVVREGWALGSIGVAANLLLT